MKDWKAILKDPQLSKRFYSLLLCSFCLVAGSLAWFFNGSTGNTDGIALGSIDAVDFQISLDGVNYTYNTPVVVPSNLVFEPVSGTGFTGEMYKPMLPVGEEDASSALAWEPTVYDVSAETNSFYCFRLYFRSDKEGYATISELNVSPAASPENRQGKAYADKNLKAVVSAGEDSVERPVESSLAYDLMNGNPVISKDYIAGAVRVSMKNLTNFSSSSGYISPGEMTSAADSGASGGSGTSILSPIKEEVIFVPNDTYHLNLTVTGSECSCSMVERWFYADDTQYEYYNGSTTASYSALTYYTESQLAEDGPVKLLAFTGERRNDGYYYGELDICVWVEGFDNEARDIMAGGEFRFSLQFDYEKYEENVNNNNGSTAN